MSLRTCKRAALALLAAVGAMCCATANGQVVISQVYGGASSSGSTYTRDFVELFNRGSTPVNLSTWSIQYASSTGTSWTKVNLSGTIQPGAYFLFAGATGTSGVAPPTPDQSGTLDMSATTGKVALIANQTTLGAIHVPAPGTNGVVDFVGYGSAVTGYEGSGPTGTNTSTILSANRLNGGCTDTDNNAADFVNQTPVAHNSASATNSCGSTAATGGCCVGAGQCQRMSQAACQAISGASYLGDFTVCVPGTNAPSASGAALIDISTSSGVTAGPTGDDVSGSVTNLPFTFWYNGQPKTKFQINTNGWLGLSVNTNSASTAQARGNGVPPQAALPNDALYAYWDDLNVTGTGVATYFNTLGTAPNRQFIVQWQNVIQFNGAAPGNTFEIILNESSNTFEFRYGTVLAQGVATGTTTVSFNAGAEDLAGTVGVDTTSTVGTGGTAAARLFTPSGQCPAVGACCKAGACTSTDATGCLVAAGVFSGGGSSCSPNPCATGACCLPNGTCSDGQTAGQCALNGGVYGGDNSLCSGTTCPATGRCCTGSTCSVGFQATCASGDWTSGGTCTTNFCATPCCNPSTAACTLIATTGGTCTGFTGAAGATCAATTCPQGSCCNTATGACALSGPSGCTGVYAGNGTTCTTNPCPPPANDNCLLVEPIGFHYTSDFTVSGQANSATNDGSYTGITGNTISGCLPTNNATTTGSAREVYFSFVPAANGSLNADMCSTLPSFDSVLSIHTGCPATTSNTIACNDDGACSAGVGLSQVLGVPVTAGQTYIIRVARFGTGTTTGYTYTLNVTTAPVGACCKPDGTCSVATSTACAASPNNGTYQGNATTCAAVSCTGACCNNTTAACTSTSQTGCTAGSTFLGIGVSCTPVPCAGQACCNNATGACTLIGTAGTCDAGSTSQGPNTVCTPSPCPASTCCNNATGACTVTGTDPCPAGTTANAASSCSPTPCPLHVCCNTATGACTVFGSDPCPSGSTSDASTSCTTNPCPQPPPPTNDLCANPIALSFGVAYQNTNTFATGDGTEGPAPSCQTNFSRSVWFTFTAPATTNYHVYSCGSTFDSVITIFSGPDCNTLTQIGCDDDTCVGGESAPGPGPGSALAADVASTPMTAGQTYTIRFSSYNTLAVGNGGPYGLLVEFVSGTTVGSCCVATSCTVTDATNCSGGTWTSGGVCSPNPCLPAGVCCRGSTCTTTITTAAACAASLPGGQTAGAFFATGTACNASATVNTPCCYADYNKTGGVQVNDIFDFLSDWFASSPFANTGGNGTPGPLNVQNIFDFLSDWFAGGC